MNKTISRVVIAVIILGGFVWILGRTPKEGVALESPSSSTSTLTAEEVSFDFGSISMAAGEVTRSFKIKNTGTDPVVIEKIYTSCMCTTASLMKGGKQFGPYGMPGHSSIPKINESMDPGEEASIEVVFDPAAHGPAGVGKIQRSIIIENNAGEPLELQFGAFVTP